ncbi:MAG: hypothetical protein ACR2RV_29040 [Verrucomicrobiales bacterium]
MLDKISEDHDSDFDRVTEIVELLNKRRGAKKVAVRDSLESKLFTTPEATIRTLVSFFCVASNSGGLYEELHWGLSLEPQLEEVGADGCIAALKRLEKIDQEYRRLEQEIEQGKDVDQEYDALWGKRQEAEIGAEGDFVWATLLWNYANKHTGSILAK